MAFPMRYVLDPALVKSDEAQKVKDACPYEAIELDMESKKMELKVGAIVWATGWNPYDAKNLEELGSGEVPNVITNVMMERLASLNGPTGGKILRPSDGKPVETVAFVQCAGSRDENYMPFCSHICCLASLKQATYIREQNPESKVTIFYIDIRALGRYEDFYTTVAEDENITLIKGKVAKVEGDPASGLVTVEAEDVFGGGKSRAQVDMVVLATGMQPTAAAGSLPADLECDENGFIIPELQKPGIYAAGCAKKPVDVANANRDATASALNAIQSTVRR
jgi:quinone-modifying oxidoreductase subunit QmoA